MSKRHDRASGTPAGSSTTAAGPAGDALSDVLHTVRLTGALFFLVDARAPWVSEVPAAGAFAPVILPGAENLISYHIVAQGPCWGGLLGQPPLRLETGDVLLIPHGDAYAMASEPAARVPATTELGVAFFRSLMSGELGPLVREGGRGARTRLVCGFLGCDRRPFNPLLASLPPLVHVRRPRKEGDRLDPLIDFALAESRDRRSGGQCVLLRLSELMFVEVVRRYLSGLPPRDSGWVAGLQDPDVGRVLALLHAQPARAWTLDTLARESGLSRSTLAERFTRLVGQPPMHYLAQWRMQLAARKLTDGASKVHAVALEVGYDSEAAFSRAFKKIVGMAPAAWRARRHG